MTISPKAFALVAYRQDPGCFVHVLLNGLDLHEKGHTVKIIIEGAATTLLAKIDNLAPPLPALFKKTMDQGLLEGYCLACATQWGTQTEAEASGLLPLSDMKGHPSMAQYIDKGFTIINF